MGSHLGHGLVAMEMTAVTNKVVLCSLSRTRGELEAGGKEGRVRGRQKGKGGREGGEERK